MVHVCIYIGIVQKKNMIKYPKANLADMLHSDSSICILLVLKNIINGKVNLADVLHSDLSIYIYIYPGIEEHNRGEGESCWRVAF
jgi:hypothetical protein